MKAKEDEIVNAANSQGEQGKQLAVEAAGAVQRKFSIGGTAITNKMGGMKLNK